LKIAAVVRPVTETPSVGGYLRGYEYKGIAFSTLVGQREVIQGAVARASALKEWGILAQESASLADVIHKFGKPSRAEGDVYWYGSDQYQTAIVFIRLTAKKVSQIDWSCG
jgi:ATP phosphoribosyltransferase regulatory subunit HisZ